MDRELPLNQGVLEALEILLPKNSFLNPQAHADAKQCSAVVAGNVEVSQKIVDVFLAAMGAQAASQGTMNNVIFGNEKFGYYETISGGMGATTHSHGASGWHSHMTNTRMTDVEIFEDRYPVRLLKYALRKHSGGDGDFRGGEGVIREIEFLEDLELNLLTQRRSTMPFGLNGGLPGQCGENILINNGEEKRLDGDHSQFVEKGSVLVIKTPGGGGLNQF
jgi:5-oxoprolinase (ATP-hydrolysing)